MSEWTQIITIGREYGAGGKTVAKRISQLVGIPCYDRTIIERTAESSGFTREILQSTEGHEAGRSILSWFVPSGVMSSYDRAILAQTRTIRQLAQEGPCVIVGRGADYVLRDLPNVVNVFLYAETEDKIRYAMETHGESYEQAARRVRQTDLARESYYHYLTKRKWGNLKNYHISLNSSEVAREVCADMIIAYARGKTEKR